MSAPALAQSPRRRDAMGPFEREFVAAKRRLGASWDAIAAMLARPTLDVRSAFDPELRASGFALPPVAPPPTRAGAVTVCGRRVPVDGLGDEELVVLRALRHGEMVRVAGLRERVSALSGEQIGRDQVRRLVCRVAGQLPAPLTVVRVGDDGWAIVSRPESAGGRRFGRVENPFAFDLPVACVAVLKALVEARGALVGMEALRKAPEAIGANRLSQENLRKRVSMINAALPAGARVIAEPGRGYRLTGGELIAMRAPLVAEPFQPSQTEEPSA